MQRFFDIVLSGIGLLLLAPLLVPLMFILRVTGEGEIFFMQKRVGRGGQHFMLYKFATMLKDSPKMDMGTLTLKNDPRVLPVGGLLRKTKVNELPQLFNVFKGDMSIIGPRPQTLRCFEVFPIKSQNQIIKVRPGLSGIGSIVFRNEEDMMHANNEPSKFYDEIIMPYKGALEEWYVSHQSLRSYFIIIGLTFWVVFGLSSGLVWRSFKELPTPPEELRNWV